MDIAEDVSFDIAAWLMMFAIGVVSWFFGRTAGFRSGRKEGFRSGKVHGRYWATKGSKDTP